MQKTQNGFLFNRLFYVLKEKMSIADLYIMAPFSQRKGVPAACRKTARTANWSISRISPNVRDVRSSWQTAVFREENLTGKHEFGGVSAFAWL